MDLSLRIGLGVTVFLGLLVFAVKTMPHWITWPGMTMGVLLFVWGIPPISRIPMLPALLFILCSGGIAASVALGVRYYSEAEQEDLPENLQARFQSPSANEILNGDLSIGFLFRNEGTTVAFLQGVGLYQVFSLSNVFAAGFDFRGSIGDPYAFKAVAPSFGPRWAMISGQLPVYLYDPATLSINGQDVRNANFPIAAHSAATISARFAITPLDLKKFRQTAVFPVIYAANADGRQVSVVCEGALLLADQIGNQRWVDGPRNGRWISVLPRQMGDDIECRLVPEKRG